jgi:hypothetical protein
MKNLVLGGIIGGLLVGQMKGKVIISLDISRVVPPVETP